MGLIPVFVYGTLRRGQGNHHLLAEAGWGGEQELPGARLHDLGPFPMAIATAATAATDTTATATPADSVQGELWWVDGATLEQLDRLEGHPRLYERHWLALASGQVAWVYLGRPRQVRHAPVLPHGRWPRTGPSALAVALALLGAGLIAGLPTPALAADCRAWLASHGQERIRLGNQLGAAHYLTKDRRLQSSPEETPVSLYRSSDLMRLCHER